MEEVRVAILTKETHKFLVMSDDDQLEVLLVLATLSAENVKKEKKHEHTQTYVGDWSSAISGIHWQCM